MALPATGYLENSGRTVAEMKQALEDQRDTISKGFGLGPRVEVTIATGTVTPGARDHGGNITVDTEGDVAADDLDTITNTNLPDGSILLVWAENASRVVTLKHGNGGVGEMLMIDSADFVLDALDKWIMFQRRSVSWVEISRSYGVVGTPRSVQVFTTAGATPYPKPAGLKYARVRIRGGGGSGGGAGGTTSSDGSAGAGGGEGEYAEKLIAAANIGSETITIGAGGAAVNGETTGNAGGTTSFGAHVTAAGGSGGATLADGSAFAGVTGTNGGNGGSGGDLHIKGEPGGSAMRIGTTDASTANGISGAGGGEGGGRSVRAGGTSATAGQDGVRGGGGSGGANAASQGATLSGAGGDGWCVVEEYF